MNCQRAMMKIISTLAARDRQVEPTPFVQTPSRLGASIDAPYADEVKFRSPLRFILEGIEGCVVLGLTLCTWPFSRRWLKHWGALSEERSRSWLGDQYVSATHDAYTRAIAIDAPADCVWPWIVQLGQGRAGFYSYELLERLVRIPVTNVESIEPTMQVLSVGDEVRIHPKAPGLPVAHVEPYRHICFAALEDSGHGATKPDPARSWSIYIEPTGASSCRLVLRSCVESVREPSWLKRLAGAFEQPIDFVMEQRMLRTVKRLAELTVRTGR